jgi:hypothetical protein
MAKGATPARIPVKVLTSCLGAGRTTLLKRLFCEDHGRRYAAWLMDSFAVSEGFVCDCG